ncbi:uncharacterized protein LOC133645320 isoform X4 [Entelurus aequoreus]|uniref:uncharacterized protein LOC133645320 isoform X4 n=1 Tax=Entelurus aequoreus TaxID=161455 RepID=UPI002B1CEDCB|nr:uncharacterized protein LOC133645320 isoform X4 [Entelurus aequoreus]XP_061896190.1 uncharacterized protein LOC133645320 isoform X4 [Entelurus aequoreus]
MKCWLSRAGTPGGPLACASVGDISALLTRLRSGWFPVGPAVDWTPADVLDPLWTGLSQCYVRPTRHPLLSVSPRGGGLPTYAVLSKVSHSHSPTSHWETTTPEMCPVKNRPTRTLITKVPWVNNEMATAEDGCPITRRWRKRRSLSTTVSARTTKADLHKFSGTRRSTRRERHSAARQRSPSSDEVCIFEVQGATRAVLKRRGLLTPGLHPRLAASSSQDT